MPRSAKRYEEYPQLARLVRVMSDGQREAVAHWHRVLTTALEGAVPEITRQSGTALTQAGLTESEVLAATGGAEGALEAWLRVMREVAAIIVDPSEGDWCCKRGMMVHPAPCPQHGFDERVLYDAGTVIERYSGVQSRERAVRVEGKCGIDRARVGEVWMSIDRGGFYVQPEMAGMNWRVVAHV